jgi:hypothetical protein
MADYDIIDSAADWGLTAALDEQPDGYGGWRVTSRSKEVIQLQRGDDKIQIEQRKPRRTDLPFRAAFVDEDGKRERIAEGDYIGEVLQTVKAFIRGYEMTRTPESVS